MAYGVLDQWNQAIGGGLGVGTPGVPGGGLGVPGGGYGVQMQDNFNPDVLAQVPPQFQGGQGAIQGGQSFGGQQVPAVLQQILAAAQASQAGSNPQQNPNFWAQKAAANQAAGKSGGFPGGRPPGMASPWAKTMGPGMPSQPFMQAPPVSNGPPPFPGTPGGGTVGVGPTVVPQGGLIQGQPKKQTVPWQQPAPYTPPKKPTW